MLVSYILGLFSVSAVNASLGIKKKVFDKMMLLERLEEEEAILVDEMKRHWNLICKTVKNLQGRANAVSYGLDTKSKSCDLLSVCKILSLLLWFGK